MTTSATTRFLRALARHADTHNLGDTIYKITAPVKTVHVTAKWTNTHRLDTAVFAAWINTLSDVTLSAYSVVDGFHLLALGYLGRIRIELTATATDGEAATWRSALPTIGARSEALFREELDRVIAPLGAEQNGTVS